MRLQLLVCLVRGLFGRRSQIRRSRPASVAVQVNHVDIAVELVVAVGYCARVFPLRLQPGAVTDARCVPAWCRCAVLMSLDA